MSYKKAWYLIDTLNRGFREPVVETVKGGRGHGGAKLTAMGRQVLDHYRTIEARAAAAVVKDLEAFAALVVDESEA